MHLILLLQAGQDGCTVGGRCGWCCMTPPSQAVACVLRGVVLLDILGCMWMVLLCGMGYYAWYHEPWLRFLGARGAQLASVNQLICLDAQLNSGDAHHIHINLGSWLCPRHAAGHIGICHPCSHRLAQAWVARNYCSYLVKDGFRRQTLILCIVMRTASPILKHQGIGTPCSELLGALFAWHLYRDYQSLHGGEAFGGFDPLGGSGLQTFESWDLCYISRGQHNISSMCAKEAVCYRLLEILLVVWTSVVRLWKILCKPRRTFDGFDPEKNPLLKGFSAAGFSAEQKAKDAFPSLSVS